jgi:hypothetical protein
VSDRMFHVLVLGGLAFVGCGGSTAAGIDKGKGDAEPSDAASAEDGFAGFPDETAYQVADAHASPDSGDASTGIEDADAGASDANEYADARIQDAERGCVPCEAPAPPP